MSKSPMIKIDLNLLAIEKALIQGDLNDLTTDQRLMYVKSVCKTVKLNPLTQPFSYIKFEGRTQLYLNRGGAEQLRMLHKISIKIVVRDLSKERELYTVIARALTPKGREEEGMGVVSIAGLRGKDLANALMKAETKAKRRATLAICGLSYFDTPSGDDDPVRETAIEEKIEEVTAQAQVTAPIEVESPKNPTDELPPAPAAPPESKGYIMRAGKNKGKLLNDLSESKLKNWMGWYVAKTDAGEPMHPDVQDDAFQITARLKELKIEDMQTELKEMKND